MGKQSNSRWILNIYKLNACLIGWHQLKVHFIVICWLFVVCPVFHQLISYTGGTKYTHGDHALATGLNFAARDPSMGDASLSISRLSPSQSATYQCKVKKSPGVDMRKVTLVVMGKTGHWVASWGWHMSPGYIIYTCHLWRLRCS